MSVSVKELEEFKDRVFYPFQKETSANISSMQESIKSLKDSWRFWGGIVVSAVVIDIVSRWLLH